MKILILNEHEVTQMLTMPECIRVMEEALADLARGKVTNPLRNIIRAEGATGFLGLMPAYRGDYGLKEVCVFPGNPARGLDTHLGAVLLHSGDTGQLLAVINASAITAIRTAAVSAVATKLLAREDARVLAILGAGVQAKSHLEAIPVVRDIEEVRIFSRSPEKAKKLTTDNRQLTTTAEQAVRGADIIVTATSAKEPIIKLQAQVGREFAKEEPARLTFRLVVPEVEICIDAQGCLVGPTRKEQLLQGAGQTRAVAFHGVHMLVDVVDGLRQFDISLS